MNDIKAINPGDWVRLGHKDFPDFRLEGTVHEFSFGHWSLGKTTIGTADDGLFYGYTILEHKPAEPDWANDRVIVDGKGDLWVRDGVKWRVAWGDGIGLIAFTAARVATEFGPITRIDPKAQTTSNV